MKLKTKHTLSTVPLQKILIFKQNFTSTETTIKTEYFSENVLI